MYKYLQKVLCRNNFFFNSFFVGILKVNDENRRIRIHKAEAWIRGSGSGSTPKCHGSGTPVSGTYNGVIELEAKLDKKVTAFLDLKVPKTTTKNLNFDEITHPVCLENHSFLIKCLISSLLKAI
jgi:hypothetical protein